MSGPWRWRWIAAGLLAAMLLQADAGWGADQRKVKNKTAPVYPALAREMNVSGTVRIEVVISADGKIKAVRPLGGHPLLIKASTEALKQWLYERGPEQTTVVEFHFTN